MKLVVFLSLLAGIALVAHANLVCNNAVVSSTVTPYSLQLVTSAPLTTDVGLVFTSDASGAVLGASRYDPATGITVQVGPYVSKPSTVRAFGASPVSTSGKLFAGTLLDGRADLYVVDPTDLTTQMSSINIQPWSGGLSGNEGLAGTLGVNDEFVVWAARSYGHHLGLLARDPVTNALSSLGKFKIPSFGEGGILLSHQYRFFQPQADDGKSVFMAIDTTGRYSIFKVDNVNPTTAEIQSTLKTGTLNRAGGVVRIVDHETILTHTDMVTIDRNTLDVVSITPLTGNSIPYASDPVSLVGEVGLEPVTFPYRAAGIFRQGRRNARYSYIEADGKVTTNSVTTTSVFKTDALGNLLVPDFANGGVRLVVQSDCCSTVTSLSLCLQVPECGFCRKHSAGDTSSTVPPYEVICLDGDASGPTSSNTCLSWHYSSADNSYSYVDPSDGSTCTNYLAA